MGTFEIVRGFFRVFRLVLTAGAGGFVFPEEKNLEGHGLRDLDMQDIAAKTLFSVNHRSSVLKFGVSLDLEGIFNFNFPSDLGVGFQPCRTSSFKARSR